MRILVTNDDGIHAAGLKALIEAVSPLGEITVVAPESPMSAVSQSITLHHPLRVQSAGERCFCVNGTPTDCVNLAFLDLCDPRPELVVSGINAGPNLGSDVIYSGTVAGAMEGVKFGVPSIAFSLATYKDHDFAPTIEIARRIVQRVIEAKELPEGVALNVNIPPLKEVKGIRVVKHGIRVYNEQLIKRKDPFNRDYFWLGADGPHHWVASDGTDFEALEEGYVTATPLRSDRNHSGALNALKEWSW